MTIKRNYTHIDQYLNELQGDIYAQPMDDGHAAMFRHVIDNWVTKMTSCNTVLDVGCGQADAQEWFEELGIIYKGVTLGSDYQYALRHDRNVANEDFSFLPYPDASFDLIWARHSLEHSPMPLLTLMEWHRVSRAWLCLIMPQPLYFQWGGKNHYSVMSLSQAEFLLDRAGWKVMWRDHQSDEREYRWMCEKIGKDEDTDAYIDHPLEEVKKFIEKNIPEYHEATAEYTKKHKVFNLSKIIIMTIQKLQKKAK